MNWIASQEQLPEENKVILLYWPEGHSTYDTSCFIVGLFKYPSFETEDKTLVWPINEISHWCEIPELPKE